jgi:tryptophan halogenase
MNSHKFVIYGGGVSAWVTAAALANAYSSDAVEIVLVNPDVEANEPSIADSGLASLRRFHSNMRISERELMHQTSATFKVGVRYRDWASSGQQFVHGLGNYGNMFDGIDFHQYAILLHQCGDKTQFDSYSLAAQSAKIGKFSFLGKDVVEKGFSLDYSVHVDLRRYSGLMQAFALKKNVHLIHGRLENLIFDASGNIQSIVLVSGEVIHGDIFFDCSGGESALMSRIEGDKFIVWSDELPVNKQANIVINSSPKSRLCTGLSAHQYGWIKSIPLRDKTLHSLTYSAEFASDEEIMVAAMNIAGDLIAEPVRVSSYAPGRRQHLWLGNCVAIGASAGNFTDLAFSYLHHVQSGILRFIDLYSTSGINHFAAREYNELTSAEYSRVLDYQQLNLMLCSSQSSSFWRNVKNIQYSEELLHKIDLYKVRGKIAFNEYETWMPGAWVSLLLGNDCWPEKHDVLLNDCNLETVANRLNQLRMAYSNLASQLSDEDEFLARYATLN